MTPSAALAAAKNAVINIGSVGTTRLRIDAEAKNGFDVALKPTVLGVLNGSGHFTVKAFTNSSFTTVTVVFTDAVVMQPVVAGIIPAGVKEVAGLRAYERAIDEIRKALERHPATNTKQSPRCSACNFELRSPAAVCPQCGTVNNSSTEPSGDEFEHRLGEAAALFAAGRISGEMLARISEEIDRLRNPNSGDARRNVTNAKANGPTTTADSFLGEIQVAWRSPIAVRVALDVNTDEVAIVTIDEALSWTLASTKTRYPRTTVQGYPISDEGAQIGDVLIAVDEEQREDCRAFARRLANPSAGPPPPTIPDVAEESPPESESDTLLASDNRDCEAPECGQPATKSGLCILHDMRARDQ